MELVVGKQTTGQAADDLRSADESGREHGDDGLLEHARLETVTASAGRP